MSPRPSYSPAANQRFATTQWSVVVAAGETCDKDSRQALANLCETYWHPIYAYIRRRTADVHEAQDLTQAFIGHVLEKQVIGKADPERGRFRAFLLTALKHFLANAWKKAAATKRGGDRTGLSLDFEAGETRYRIEPVDALTPEMIYERRWITTLLERVLEMLRAELTAAGKQRQFDELKDSITAEATAERYAAAAETLGVTAGAAKQAAYRMRKRYRELFRAEVARTVADESEVDDEIGRLLAALGG